MNLALALVWLAVSAVLYFTVDHGQPGGDIRALPLSGMALILGLYNLARWWSVRSMPRTYRNPDQVWQERRRILRRPGDDRTPDPTFNFTDRPPNNGITNDPGERGASAP